MPMEPVRPGSDLRQGVSARDRAERQSSAQAQSLFRERLAQAHVGQLNERIDQSLARIDELAGRLGQSLNLADLRRYRDAVATLFKDLTANMVQVKTELEWDAQAWEHRTMVTIRRVNEELERLSEMVVAQEQDRLAILAKIGEIKGMLLDVRM